jgi:hypothetical protein
LSLCFNWAPHHEGILGNGGIAPHILHLGTRLRWVVSFTPQPLYPQGRVPGTHWIGGWVGSRANLDAVVSRKIPSPYQDSNLLIIQPVAQCYTSQLFHLHLCVLLLHTHTLPSDANFKLVCLVPSLPPTPQSFLLAY